MASRSLLLRTLGSKRLPVRNRRPVVEVAGRGLSSVPSNSTTEGDGSKSNSNSGGNSGGNSGSTGGEVAPVVHHQAFIKTRLSAGEWDPDFTDPLYRPKFKSSARIIAADDFAARPTVGFSGEFNSFQDAMVTLSWLDQKDHSHIYKLYLDMMLSAESSNSSNGAPTSHEYVMRVIAQQYNITAERVAAVVQLQHNEEQIILHDPGRKLLTETANRMDTLIKKEISDAYEHYKTNQPDSFTEDPVGVNGLPDRKKWKIAADVLDVELMARNATVRDDQRARLLIDGHVYVEDVDEDTIPVPMDADCQRLMKRQQRMKAAAAKQRTENLQSQPPSPSDSVRHHHHEQQQATAREPEWRTTNGDGKTRERWKFIAQTGKKYCNGCYGCQSCSLCSQSGPASEAFTHTHTEAQKKLTRSLFLMSFVCCTNACYYVHSFVLRCFSGYINNSQC